MDGDINNLMADLAGKDDVEGVKEIDEFNAASEVTVKEKKKNKKGRVLGDGVKEIDEFNAAEEVILKEKKKNKKARLLGDGVKNIDEPNTADEVSVKEKKKNKKNQVGGVVNEGPVKKPRRMKEEVPLELKQDSPTKRKRGEETVSFVTEKTKKKSTVEEPNQNEEKLKKSAAKASMGRVGRLKKNST